MRKVAAFFLALCAGVFSNNNVANADVYTLDFYNVDDLMTGYITNSKKIDTPILQVSFLGNSGPVDISPYVTDGLNDIHIQEAAYPHESGATRLSNGADEASDL